MYIDSHCHLNMLSLDDYENDMSRLVDAVHAADITTLLNISTSMDDIPDVVATAEKFQQVYASVGIHPSETVNQDCGVEDLMSYAVHEKVIAIGETGLDYHYNSTGLDRMRDYFCMHIELAKTLKKPLIIHTRSAKSDTIRLLKEKDASSCGAVMHCFTEDWTMAKSILDMGFYISISGIVTFKNADNVAMVAKQVPLDRLLIETDSPYLAPVPYRGKQNLPLYVPLVAQKIAQLRNIEVELVAQCSRDNFNRLFGLQELG